MLMPPRWLWLAVPVVLAAVLAVLWARGLLPWQWANPGQDRPPPPGGTYSGPPPAGHRQATFGGGCFWCTEAVFRQLNGVHAVANGYSGGAVKNPTYRQVCSGTTGHAEVIQVIYDPAVISYADLLEVFWKTHDPTTRDRQGNDHGPQYRSVIFYHDEEQRQFAEEYRKKLDASGAFAAPIVTEIEPFTEFFRAEEYHQNYFEANPRQPYCAAIIRPKLEKFESVFKDRLRPPAPR
jgi:peptide-methionine (S)-S-oxide reductase